MQIPEFGFLNRSFKDYYMKKSIQLLSLILLTGSLFGQKQFTAKAIPAKAASFYHPFFENILVSGQWIGEVYTPSGMELNLTNGSGTFAQFDPSSNECNFKFKGNTTNGIWNGYIYYMEKTKKGNLFIEGEFKDGLPNGKMICRLSDGNYIAGTFMAGKSFEKVSLQKDKQAKSAYCNGFDFIQFLKNDASQLSKFTRETEVDDPLYGAAILLSNIATVSDKHSTIDQFLECAKLSQAVKLINNPEFAMAGADAVKAVFGNPLWKDKTIEDLQDQLKEYLVLRNYENLAQSDEFISFLGCQIEESRRW
jgi:hypothetical protein